MKREDIDPCRRHRYRQLVGERSGQPAAIEENEGVDTMRIEADKRILDLLRIAARGTAEGCCVKGRQRGS